MTTAAQTLVVILGALMALVGILLFVRKGNRGRNTIKMLGMEFQLASSSLVIVVLGCVLILSALRLLPTGGTEPTLPERPTNTPTPPAPVPPEFVTRYVYPSNDWERAEYTLEPGQPAGENLDDFLRLTRLAFGTANQTNRNFQAVFTIRNTSRQPVLLDLNERFFSMADDQGHTVSPVYFCCPAQAETLAPGGERTVELFFPNAGWYGKGVSAKWIALRVDGFLPVVSASWKARPLITRD